MPHVTNNQNNLNIQIMQHGVQENSPYCSFEVNTAVANSYAEWEPWEGRLHSWHDHINRMVQSVFLLVITRAHLGIQGSITEAPRHLKLSCSQTFVRWVLMTSTKLKRMQCCVGCLCAHIFKHFCNDFHHNGLSSSLASTTEYVLKKKKRCCVMRPDELCCLYLCTSIASNETIDFSLYCRPDKSF